jgi:hypothetical protein
MPCRAGLPAQVAPDGDTLICDANATIASPHLLVAVAAQNYGENSYRIRQPFDFTGRTGKIVFDAEALPGGLLGWVSIEVTDEPIPVPGFSVGRQASPPYANDEGSVFPKNGFEVHFNGDGPAGGALSLVALFSDYVETDRTGTNLVAVPAEWGKLNRFEIDVSQEKLEVYATPPSADGTTFAPKQRIFSQAVSLPFSRGYVHITTHNHATMKYTAPGSAFQNGFENLDAWIARWDNVGFDGPVIPGWREYEVADPLTPAQLTGSGSPISGLNTGFAVPDVDSGKTATLHFESVDPGGMTRARVTMASWYCLGCGPPVEPFALKYRMNGHAWHDRALSPGELAYFTSGGSQGALGQVLDVPIGELVPGSNTLELVSVNVPQNYPPGVANVDLVLDSN